MKIIIYNFIYVKRFYNQSGCRFALPFNYSKFYKLITLKEAIYNVYSYLLRFSSSSLESHTKEISALFIKSFRKLCDAEEKNIIFCNIFIFAFSG